MVINFQDIKKLPIDLIHNLEIQSDQNQLNSNKFDNKFLLNNEGLSINTLLPEISSKDHSMVVYNIINLIDTSAVWLIGLLAVGIIAALQSTAAETAPSFSWTISNTE